MKTSITAVEKAGWSTPLVIRGNLEQGIARAAQWGYDGIELHLTDSNAVDKKAVISALRANNISLTSIGTGPSYSQQGIFLTSPVPETRRGGGREVGHLGSVSSHAESLRIFERRVCVPNT